MRPTQLPLLNGDGAYQERSPLEVPI